MAQYYVNGKLVIHTLGVRRFLSSHSGIYIALIMRDVLREYGISVDQVYSITADNGANMIKAVKVFRLMQSHTIDVYFDEYERNLETEDHTFLDNFIDGKLKKCGNLDGVFAIHCAAHLLQLAIRAAVEAYDENEKILAQAHELVVEVRKDNIALLLNKNGLSKPPLDVVTRWSSEHKMVYFSLFFANNFQ